MACVDPSDYWVLLLPCYLLCSVHYGPRVASGVTIRAIITRPRDPCTGSRLHNTLNQYHPGNKYSLPNSNGKKVLLLSL